MSEQRLSCMGCLLMPWRLLWGLLGIMLGDVRQECESDGGGTSGPQGGDGDGE